MSIDELNELSKVERARAELIKKLPFFKRLKKKYMTGDSFWAYHFGGLTTWPTAFPLGVAAGSTGFVAKLAPLWGLAVKAGTAVKAVVIGLVSLSVEAIGL